MKSRDWFDIWEMLKSNPVFVFAFLVIVILIVLGVQAGIKENDEWMAFRDANHCVIVGVTSPTTSFVYGLYTGSDGTRQYGNHSVTTNGSTAWQCNNDGVSVAVERPGVASFADLQKYGARR